MQGASSLTRFRFETSKYYNYEPHPDEIHSLDKMLAEVLEQNITLETITLLTEWENHCEEFVPRITSGLDLNKYGRRIARDSKTTLSDFVTLLYSPEMNSLSPFPIDTYTSKVDTNTDRIDDTDTDSIETNPGLWLDGSGSRWELTSESRILNIHHGLLRGQPGLWSAGASASPGRKSKTEVL